MAAEDRRREKKINLAVLRNLDKFAANILDTASSVAHYTFDANTEKWEKTEFEGSLFVYNRNEARTEVAILIMNRLKKENFHIIIHSGMEFKTQDPFLLCKTTAANPDEEAEEDEDECEVIKEVIQPPTRNEMMQALENLRACTFSDPKNRDKIHAIALIAELADDEEQLKSEIDEALEMIDEKEAPKIDVMKMFAKAKEEYDKKQDHKDHIGKSASVPKFTPVEQKRPAVLKRTSSVPDGMHEEINEEDEDGGISMISHSSKEDSNVLMELLQRAKNADRKSRARTLSYGEPRVAENSRDFMEHLKKFSGTKAGDLAFVEDYNSTDRRPGDAPKPQVIDVAKLEASVLLSHVEDVASEEQKPEIDGFKQEGTTLNPAKELSRITASSTELLSPAKITPTKQTVSKLGTPGKGRGKGLTAALNQSDMKCGGDKVASVGGSKIKPVGDAQRTPRKDIALAMKFPDPPNTGTVTSLMSPMQFTAATKVAPSQSNSSTIELAQLDKQQFKEAFVNLLQTDEGFVERLHRSYLNVRSKR